MTPEHAKALLPFITAYSEGKTIQYLKKGDTVWRGMNEEGAFFHAPADTLEYRIKPATHPDVSFSPDGYLLPPRVGEWASKQPLTEADILEGHRPYVKGEVLREGDLYQYKNGSVERVYGLAGCPTESLLGIGFTTAPLPEPKLVPLTSEELPPVVWIREKDAPDRSELLHSVKTNGMLETANFCIPPEEYSIFEFSSDRKTWHSLMKEVQA